MSVATLGPLSVAGHCEELIRFTDRSYIERGMSAGAVRETLGAPSAQLAPDVWVYFDFAPKNAVPRRVQPAASGGTQDALIVVFRQGRVGLIRVSDSKPVRAFMAQQQKQPATGDLVAVQ